MTKLIITITVVLLAAIILLPNLSLKAYGWLLSGIRKVLSWVSIAIVWAWTQPASYVWKYISISWDYVKAFDAKFKTADKAETKEEAASTKAA